MSSGGIEYSNVAEIKGPLVIVDGVENAAFDELVEIETKEGEHRLGKVLEIGNGKAIIQVFEGTTGLSIAGTSAKFVGKVMEMPVSKEILGRVFDGLGRPKDGLPEPIADKLVNINGEAMNPEQREYPKDFIQTGVSVIDGMITLVRGQKLPIFSGSGMSHNILAAQIARQATVVGTDEDFAVVFAAIGVQYSESEYFRKSLEESGALKRSVLFLNLADDPASVIMEILLGKTIESLAHTVSYARIGIMLLVHAALLLTVNGAYGSLGGSSSPVALGMIIGGNLGIMMIEGLIVYIQSLRLHLYEYFTKWYDGGNIVFKNLMPETVYNKFIWKK